MPNFDEMNETDVREIIVRPLLTKLGYQHGTKYNILTEQTFRYAKAFLGRKKPSKDPALTGRADYILDVVGFGRWVVEVKAPKEPIDQDVVEQAHTYAAHPEVAALFFLVTNGREFRLYRTSSLNSPLMAWDWSDADEIFMALGNLVGPEAIERKMKLLQADPGKPLAPGVPSRVRIVGGYIRYEDHISSHPLFNPGDINGLELAVTGGSVERLEDGRLHSIVKTANSSPLLLLSDNSARREDEYKFSSGSEYISKDQWVPTIFQGFYDKLTPAGTIVSIPGLGKIPTPFDMRLTATTEAVGFFENDTFKGTMQLRYEYYFGAMPMMIRAALEQKFGSIPHVLTAEGGGCFEVQIAPF